MKNESACKKEYKSFELLKQLWRKKPHRLFHLALLTVFLLLNIIFVKGLFNTGDGYFGAEDICLLIIMFAAVAVLVLLFVMTPLCLKYKGSAGIKILSLWLPQCVYVTAQTLVFLVCAQFSSKFELFGLVALLFAVGICIVLFVWTAICAGLYLVARSKLWYFIGFVAVGFAPIVISHGCYGIYNAASLLPNKDWNPLKFNIFSAILASFNHPIALVLVGAVLCVLIYICCKRKIYKKISANLLRSAYKTISIYLISLSCGFLVAKNFLGEGQLSLAYIIAFLVTVFVVALGFALLTFRKGKWRLRTGVIFVALAVSSALVLGAIPAKAQKLVYDLPESKDVQTVSLFLDSIENFKIDRDIEECIELHGELLEIFKAGHKPDKTEQSYKAPGGMAKLWEDINFNYRLKNGKSFYRDYSGLRDPAFDEFYIKLLQSDVYINSLKNCEFENPSIRYCSFANGGSVWCEPPQSAINELLATYCEELKTAEKSAFYEDFETIELTGVYSTGHRIIYIPASFSKTRELAESYISLYSENNS